MGPPDGVKLMLTGSTAGMEREEKIERKGSERKKRHGRK